MKLEGSVRANAPIVRSSRVASADASPTQARQPVPLLQLVARGDPPGGDDVRPLPAVACGTSRTCCSSAASTSATRRCGIWWNRFGPMFAGDIRRQRVSRMRGFRHWRWHLDEMYVKLNGEMVYLWRAVDHEGEILESYITKTRDKDAALRFMKKALKRHGSPEAITTDGLRSYRAAMNELGNAEKQEVGRWANNRVREQPPAVPTTRAGDAQVPTNEDATEVRLASTPTSTITSISNAISSIARPTRNDARPPWPSGRSLAS